MAMKISRGKKMLSFRQKIFLSFVFLFIILTLATFPIVTHIVRSIAQKAMEERANELIDKIQPALNNAALVRRLKDQKSIIFFRVSIISDDGKVLYDSHTKQLMGPRFSQEYITDHPEIVEAFSKGKGYSEDYSELLQQKFSFFAKTFDFHGKNYVIRMAFPFKYFSDLTDDFEIAFLVLTTTMLLLFALLTWFIINHLTSPIQQIINAVAPYQEGKQTTIPEIKLSSTGAKDSFSKLAMTLNSMSNKIQKHIDSLTSERNEKEAILESLVEGVIAVDDKMMVSYANSTAKKFIGRDLTGQNFSAAQQPQSYALLKLCQREKQPLTDDITLGKANAKIYLDIVAAPKGDNSGAILVMQDKSPHYKLLEMRKDFIANASHELKTPITIIRGFAEMLHDNPELSRETKEEMTDKIVSNCQRMTRLVHDLLTLSDTENIPLSQLEQCNLRSIIDECANRIHDVFPDAQIKIEQPTEEELLAMIDPSLMELAFMNLLENAAKYSTPPAEIDINLQKEGDKIRITIADKGMGIPKQDLEHIFERFYTVDKAHSQKMGGSGLGLSIVQNIIHKHFGQISLESEVGQGTTFTIVLPAA
jgi:two-component system, OmpR family, phosphate regulon sensor histidine kinase PhoR